MNYNFQLGAIDGVYWSVLKPYVDDRGWLCELWRQDVEMHLNDHGHDKSGRQQRSGITLPVMSYISMTLPGTARGPHEHAEQSDLFAFISGTFRVWLWDTRRKSMTFEMYQDTVCGDDTPRLLTVPPGVVHAYKNIGNEEAFVVNCPNRLYRGLGGKGPVDEIRHEGSSVFMME